jgi:hypothetical protein
VPLALLPIATFAIQRAHRTLPERMADYPRMIDRLLAVR